MAGPTAAEREGEGEAMPPSFHDRVGAFRMADKSIGTHEGTTDTAHLFNGARRRSSSKKFSRITTS